MRSPRPRLLPPERAGPLASPDSSVVYGGFCGGGPQTNRGTLRPVTLPRQVDPPVIALSEVAPSRVVGADVVAIPVMSAGSGASADAADGSGPTLGPGAAELLDELDEDLFVLLDVASATGEAGQITDRAVLDATGLSNPDLRLVLLVGVGEGTPADLRRAGAALARRTFDFDASVESLNQTTREIQAETDTGRFGASRRVVGRAVNRRVVRQRITPAKKFFEKMIFLLRGD